MRNHNVYAIVLNDEIVNLIVAENLFQAMDNAKIYDRERATAVDCTDFKCGVGDYYIDGQFFYKDKETRIPNTSIDSLINGLTLSNESLNSHIEEINTKYDNVEQSILTLLQSNTDIEIALCELAMLISGEEE